MKHKRTIGAIILLMGMTWGIVSANNYQSSTYYYQSELGFCLSIQTEKMCDWPGTGCTEVIGSGAPKQLYQSRITLFQCEDPLAWEN